MTVTTLRPTAEDTFADLCRRRGIKSTRSKEARMLALRMAREAFGDSDIGQLIGCIEGVESGIVDLVHRPWTEDERAATVDACHIMAYEIEGHAERVRDDLLRRIPG